MLRSCERWDGIEHHRPAAVNQDVVPGDEAGTRRRQEDNHRGLQVSASNRRQWLATQIAGVHHMHGHAH
jgi:hypothetical protein